MWKCPNCETINKEDICVVCGERRIEVRDYNIQNGTQTDSRTNNQTGSNGEKAVRKKSKAGKIFVILIIIMVVLGLAGGSLYVYMQHQENKRVADFNASVQEAYNLLSENKDARCFALLQETKRKYPNLYNDSFDALYMEGFVYMNDRNYQEAIRCFDKALRIDKTDECLVNSAVCYAKTGEYDEAERILSESNSGSVSGRYVQAEIAYAKKDFDEAITGFEYVKDNAQEEYLKRNAYVSLAEVYRDLRVDNPRDSFYLDKQIAVLEEALVKLKNRDDLTITEMLAGAYDSAQKYDLSVEKFRRLLKLGYDREYIYLNLVKIHHKTDNLKEAEVVLKEMQEKYPESCDCYIQYARLYASIEADKSPEDRDYSKVYEYYLLAKKYNDDSKRNDDMDKLETEIQQLKDAGWLE